MTTVPPDTSDVVESSRSLEAREETVGRQIEALLSTGYRFLRFPAELERRFIADQDQARRKHHLVMLIASLLLYDAFIIGDRELIPDIFWMSVKVRLLMMTPLCLLGMVAIRFGRSHYVREFLVMLSGTAAGCTIVVFMLNTQSPFASHYYMGLPLMVIYQNTVQRVSFWFAVAGSLFMLLASALGLSEVHLMAPQVHQTFVMVMFATSLFTLIALYRLEHEERTSYLLQVRDNLSHAREHRLLDNLKEANMQLELLTRSDPLTGIANRRHFQEQLSRLWKESAAEGTALSLMMIDVDYFKLYNDHYGHLAGDQCLRRVAAAINAALRKPADIAARYGGEEFSAILPGTSSEQAMAVAERVRQSVLGIDLLHEASQVAKIVTISIGVATFEPGGTEPSTESLIKRADEALYHSKTAGRNRATLAEAFRPSSPAGT